MTRREREILEHAFHAVTEQAARADARVDEAIGVGHSTPGLCISWLGCKQHPLPEG